MTCVFTDGVLVMFLCWFLSGSSKVMEPDAGVELMIDAVATKYNVIDSTIICNDDLTYSSFFGGMVL